jgi:hypothetical protein
MLETVANSVASTIGLAPWLVEAVCIALITVAAQRTLKWIRELQPGRALWRLNEDSVTWIVITSGALRDHAEKTETVYPAEAKAATEIESFLKSLYPSMQVRVATSNYASAAIYEGNLIVIGGPVRNRVSKDLFQVLQPQLSFEGYDLVDGVGGRMSAEIDDGRHITRDVGMVYLGNNPSSHHGRTVILAGCRTFGCLAAARALLRSDVKRTVRLIPKTRPLAFAVTARVHNDDVVDVEVAMDLALAHRAPSSNPGVAKQ